MEIEVDDAALISIDSKGIDVRVRLGAQVFLISTPFSIISVHVQFLCNCFDNLLCIRTFVVQHAEIIL